MTWREFRASPRPSVRRRPPDLHRQVVRKRGTLILSEPALQVSHQFRNISLEVEHELDWERDRKEVPIPLAHEFSFQLLFPGVGRILLSTIFRSSRCMNVMSHFVIEDASQRQGPEWGEPKLARRRTAKNIIEKQGNARPGSMSGAGVPSKALAESNFSGFDSRFCGGVRRGIGQANS